MWNRWWQFARRILTVIRARLGTYDSDADSVIEASEKLLEGRVLPDLKPGADHPHWVWINTLAHADEPDLEEIALSRDQDDDDAEVRVQRAVLRLLSRELLAGARRGNVTVRELQRTVVIPIELQALNSRKTPASLVRLVRAGLEGAIKDLQPGDSGVA